MKACPGRLNSFLSVLFGYAIFTCHYCVFSQNLIITELFRNPSGPETALCAGASHEFIEITNFGTDTFFIDNFFISDGTESDTIIPFGYDLPGIENCFIDQKYIAPGQIALILDSDYSKAVQSNNCGFSIHSGTVLLRCSDAELGNGLTDDEGVLLYKGTRQNIDSVICIISDNVIESENPLSGKLVFTESGNTEGISVVAKKILFDKKEYGVSKDSVSPGWLEQMHDGWLVEWKLGTYELGMKETVCSLIVYNADAHNESQKWSLYKSDLKISEGQLTLNNNMAKLAVLLLVDSTDYVFTINKISWLIELSSLCLPQSPLKINEIYPFANLKETEWIELFNPSKMSINLKGWSIGNFEDTVVISRNDLLLSPGALIVLARNKSILLQNFPYVAPVVQPSSWHSLNNNSDTLCLFDVNGNLKDMVCYRSSWFENNGAVIERINSELSGCDSVNWAQSNHGGTPGYPNNSILWRNVTVTQMEIGPIPFTPDNDGKDDLLSIKMAVPGSHKVHICIYSFDGREIYDFDGPVQKQYFWNGKDKKGNAAQCGPFFVVAEITGSKGKKILRKKGILWRKS